MSVALLAPVPEEHLLSGQDTLSESGKVVEIINGYGNTFSSFEAADKDG